MPPGDDMQQLVEKNNRIPGWFRLAGGFRAGGQNAWHRQRLFVGAYGSRKQAKSSSQQYFTCRHGLQSSRGENNVLDTRKYTPPKTEKRELDLLHLHRELHV